LKATVARRLDNEVTQKVTVSMGDIPIMVRSNHCHLKGLNEQELIKKKEDAAEFGGYFIINGNEKIIRMLIVNKRNYPIAFTRSSFVNRAKFFSEYAC
jgi:DNA-directed RNA polymerase I subunit RPA2